MIADWILILCIGLWSCDSRGGITTSMVSETQCKALLDQQPSSPTYIRVQCVSPKGEVFFGKK